jgi:hypothetical protein
LYWGVRIWARMGVLRKGLERRRRKLLELLMRELLRGETRRKVWK